MPGDAAVALLCASPHTWVDGWKKCYDETDWRWKHKKNLFWLILCLGFRFIQGCLPTPFGWTTHLDGNNLHPQLQGTALWLQIMHGLLLEPHSAHQNWLRQRYYPMKIHIQPTHLPQEIRRCPKTVGFERLSGCCNQVIWLYDLFNKYQNIYYLLWSSMIVHYLPIT